MRALKASAEAERKGRSLCRLDRLLFHCEGGGARGARGGRAAPRRRESAPLAFVSQIDSWCR